MALINIQICLTHTSRPQQLAHVYAHTHPRQVPVSLFVLGASVVMLLLLLKQDILSVTCKNMTLL